MQVGPKARDRSDRQVSGGGGSTLPYQGRDQGGSGSSGNHHWDSINDGAVRISVAKQ